MDNKKTMPLIALRNMVMFPSCTLSFEVVGKAALDAVQKAYDTSGFAFLSAKRNDDEDSADVFRIGTVSTIKRIFPLGQDRAQVVAQGEYRAFVESFENDGIFTEVVTVLSERPPYENTMDLEASVLAVKVAFEEYIASGAKILPETIKYIMASEDPLKVSDLISGAIAISYIKKQELLLSDDVSKRLELLTELLLDRAKALEIQSNILNKARQKIEKSQKEYFLKEQAKAINEELGETSGAAEEIEEYERKAKELNLPERVMEKLQKELKRLKRISGYAQEGAIIRDYIQWLLDTPWSEKTEENPDLILAEEILNDEHYGLFKVKERIMEFLCVKQNTKGLDSPVLCLLGPPGVGKTSVAKSIAKALNRNYQRMSLGGIRDEAEIRGHRRTYIGSMPGRIIYLMNQAKSTNPLILLDEIDKLGSDYKGDPASALLEVLDAEQNHSFRDNYLEVSYDLSDVFFICTANSIDTIPPALKDRLEIIELSSYTLNEKFHIGKDFLIKKQKEKNGIEDLHISDEALYDIISYYTKEAGVRQLERLIAKICRKAVREVLMEGKDTIEITADNLSDYLGIRKYRKKNIASNNLSGSAVGLAWTSTGGQTLLIEACAMEGKGKLQLTGSLGDVMKESAHAAISYLRTNASKLSIDTGFYKEKDIHIHIPEGAVPKDGPSAGITLCTALISALSNIPARSDTAMTGEITLLGKVLPIGGLKEKILGARAAGIKRIIIPRENEQDLSEIEEEIKEGIEFIFADKMEDVIKEAFYAEFALNSAT
ncbi:endopeptidase La [Anaeropeptidivorans aminofermentans]|uniref:endopeptidase La n=1 Tax=Anaeropeptidivorans aminofermentans TaxID=2934315 RepID=UPI002023E21C|nr:endopeptidase La [Anaeropeptidivorans aminofermentans]